MYCFSRTHSIEIRILPNSIGDRSIHPNPVSFLPFVLFEYILVSFLTEKVCESMIKISKSNFCRRCGANSDHVGKRNGSRCTHRARRPILAANITTEYVYAYVHTGISIETWTSANFLATRDIRQYRINAIEINFLPCVTLYMDHASC